MNNLLHIFDFDYTLYKTYENIFVWSPRGDSIENGKRCFKLNPQEYHHYNFGSDEFVDDSSFVNFSFINWEKSKPIFSTLNIFNLIKDKIILTSRCQEVESDIRSVLKGDFKFFGLCNGKPEEKIKFLENLNTKDFIIYEDSHLVINLCNEKKYNNVKVSHNKTSTSLTYNLYNIK